MALFSKFDKINQFTSISLKSKFDDMWQGIKATATKINGKIVISSIIKASSFWIMKTFIQHPKMNLLISI